MTKILSFYKNRGPVSVILAVVLSVFFVVTVVEAATTISTNINTGGTLTVTGTSNFTGLSTFLGGATTTTLTLLNGEIISNATDGVIQLGGIASTTSLTLLNGETITNATDGTIALTGAFTVSGASTLTGLTSMIQASSTRLSVFDTAYFGGTATTTVNSAGTVTVAGDISVTAGEVGASKTRTTGLTGSFQTIWGDLTYEGAAGGTSSYHAGMMGNFMGTALTNTNATIHAGTIGKYSVVTSDALVGPKAGLVGEAETSVANSAVMAVLGGDTGTVTPGAAYAVRYLNSTAASKFTYGLDLFSAAVGSYKAVDYGTADIRLQNGETISNGTDGIISLGGKVTVAGAALGSHLASSQTTAPVVTITGGSSITCTNGAGTAATCTDMRGQMRFTPLADTAAATVTFNVAYTVAPVCTISPGNTATADDIADLVVTTSTTALTITPDAAWAADAKIINYICVE